MYIRCSDKDAHSQLWAKEEGHRSPSGGGFRELIRPEMNINKWSGFSKVKMRIEQMGWTNRGSRKRNDMSKSMGLQKSEVSAST